MFAIIGVAANGFEVDFTRCLPKFDRFRPGALPPAETAHSFVSLHAGVVSRPFPARRGRVDCRTGNQEYVQDCIGWNAQCGGEIPHRPNSSAEHGSEKDRRSSVAIYWSAIGRGENAGSRSITAIINGNMYPIHNSLPRERNSAHPSKL
jgi:hypothetical protein